MKPMAAISKGLPRIYRGVIDMVEKVRIVSGYRWELMHKHCPNKNLQSIKKFTYHVYGCRNVSIFDVMYMYLNTPYIDNNTVIYMSFC